MVKGIELFDYTGEGFAKVIRYQGWRVAIINYADRYNKKNIEKLERHLLTDEVFVLLEGEATLIAEDGECPMVKNKLYNVKAGAWHAIYVSEDAKVLIVENNDTGPENSEYMEFNRGE